jgi:hypothetical protein
MTAGRGSRTTTCRSRAGSGAARVSFKPIRIPDYVCQYLNSDPGLKADELTARLRKTLKAYQAGARCQCGEPIWVIGSAEVGHMCFTCITGESDPSGDYEVAEACDKRR